MKKIFIVLSVSVLLLAAIPIIGNTLIEKNLTSKIEELKSHGVEVSIINDSSYLTTKNHYEFLVKDIDMFVEYLNNYSVEQLPSYTNALIDGVLVGADLEYSNFPFSDAVSIDIYPLSLSKQIREELGAKDKKLEKYINGFLESKGVLYHVNYDVVSEDFDGYLKDIKETQTLQDGTKVLFTLESTVYQGNGKLIAPTQLISSVKTLSIAVEDKSTTVKMNLNGFTNSSNFESSSTYLTSFGLNSLELNITTDTLSSNALINASKIKANFSSNTQANYAQVSAKSSYEDLVFNSEDINFKSTGFNYDISVNKMDKDALEELRVTTSKANLGNSLALEKELEKSMINLLSKGLEINIADFSLANIVIDKKEDLGGFTLVSMSHLKRDDNLAQKINYTPLLLVQNIGTNVRLKLSKKVFSYLVKSVPMLVIIEEYAKPENSNLVFDITFKDGEFKINGKVL